jgi:hypothetical protein
MLDFPSRIGDSMPMSNRMLVGYFDMVFSPLEKGGGNFIRDSTKKNADDLVFN